MTAPKIPKWCPVCNEPRWFEYDSSIFHSVCTECGFHGHEAVVIPKELMRHYSSILGNQTALAKKLKLIQKVQKERVQAEGESEWDKQITYIIRGSKYEPYHTHTV